MARLGVVGTLVWDRIHMRDGRGAPVEGWGGIAYALGALSAALPEGWEDVPILKIGTDMEVEAMRFLRTVPRLDLEAGVRVVAEPNNRVELRYLDRDRRTERLTGGVPPWTWDELEPIVADLDALYVNFISGFELELEAARRLRLGFKGPIYADLHSLFLSVGPDGRRAPRPLDAWRDWLSCFDLVQVNEDELECLAHGWGDPWRLAAEVVGDELRAIFVTLGPRGAAYIASSAFEPWPQRWRDRGIARDQPLGVPGPVRSGQVDLEATELDGDPTGCGDVWGSTCFARLLAGASLDDALRAANRAASLNVLHRGATGLHDFLQGRIPT